MSAKPVATGDLERRGDRPALGYTWPPFEPCHELSTKHGAHSERKVKPLATIQKRRFLRQNRLRQNEVDGIGLALLDSWSRAQAKVELLDAWFAEHGVIDDKTGKPAPALSLYFTALTVATKTLGRLHDHLKRQAEIDPFEALQAHLHAKANNGDRQ